jgi:hypothetical protein
MVSGFFADLSARICPSSLMFSQVTPSYTFLMADLPGSLDREPIASNKFSQTIFFVVIVPLTN